MKEVPPAMKRLIYVLLALCLLLPLAALAEEAQDITAECIVNKQAWNDAKPDKVRDSNYATFYKGQAVTIQAPEGKTIGALMIKWQVQPKVKVVLLRSDDGNKFTEVLREDCKYAQQLIVLDNPETILRFKAASGQMEVNEIVVLTPGEIPASIPQWKDAPEKVDLMLFSTHPDDEVLWFGGLLPYYAGEQDKDVLVINAVYGWFYRRQELLDALWTCGVDIYPIMLGYPDQVDTVNEIIREWGVKNRQPKNKAVALIRQYKPDVVVLHDVDGEYGHNAHKAFCWLGQQGVERAADPNEHAESFKEWGVWNVPKTYIHLWGDNQMRMDWKQPLTAFGGKTGLEVADKAFHCHVSQSKKQYRVEDGGEYDNALFGLWRTNVGLDLVKNDLFENIPAE